MRRNSLILFLLSLLTTIALATGCQSDETGKTASSDVDASYPSWQQIYTDVTFAGPSLGLISGWHGTILRSTDTGQTWSVMDVDSPADLNSVAILNENTAVAVGSGGNILRSTDGGLTWKPVDSPTDKTLNRVVPIGGGAAAAIGWHGTIIMTSDGGKTWSDQSRGFDYSLFFEDVDFTPEGFGLVVSSSGRIFRTLNVKDWQELTVPGEGIKLYSVDINDASNAVMAGNVDVERSFMVGGKTVILKTSNGGDEWQYGRRDMNADLLAIKFINSEDIVSAGWNGVIWISGDRGENWQPAISHTNQALRALASADGATVVAVGDGQTIIISRDAGITWKKLKGA